ncbi:response regulator [Thiomicrorhabdus sp. 6S2-11]|uniref:Response regulator n=1 Tax=Thiomicrorhabdus marina TaxID=2818442 RepID=A0ABS3Q4F1_9GAMM|nr:response regulator [Thiomicrorhabdus marina]MBO1927207.1 response regulator [Thiomicrorhabdus marina]
MNKIPHVLVVDDSEVIRKLLQITLQQSNMRVRLAESLSAGLKAAQSELFDLIIVDYMLSTEENGLQLIAQLRYTQNAATPVLMLSAEVEQKYKQQAKQLGVKAWVKKPFSPQSISKLSQQILGIN